MELQTLLQSASIVATDLAGVPAYFTDFRVVDLLGYNEKTIARTDALLSENFRNYWPGHRKSDSAYILAEYKPDLFFLITDDFGTDDLLRNRGYKYNDEIKGWYKGTMFSET